MTATTIHLVRHGLVHNPAEVMYGRLPRFRLSVEGQQQAKAAAAHLKKKSIAALYSSPLLRTRQTAQAILAHHPHLPLRTKSELLEIHVPWDGTPITEMNARNWDMYTGNQPPYETPHSVVVRVRRFLDWVRCAHGGEEVIAVSHGDVIAFTTLWALGAAVDWRRKAEMKRFGFVDNYPQTASITSFTFGGVDKNELPCVRYHRPY
jgi:broad specificity phosphatase PhoE